MTMLRRLLSMMALLLLAACGGGGGSAGTPPFGPGSGSDGGGDGGGGGTTGTPSLALSISSSTVTATAPATVTLTLRSAAGSPIAGKVVNVATGRTGLAVLSAGSVLTSSDGTATVGVQAASGSLTGADEVIATTQVNDTAVSGSVGFSVTGATATITAQLVPNSNELRASTSPVDLVATLRDERGQPLANQLVSFSSDHGHVELNPESALTDASGVARTKAAPADASESDADTLIVATRVNGRDLESSVNVQLVAELPSLALTLSNSSISATAPATVRATVRNAAGALVPGAVVTFGTQFNLGVFDAVTAITGATGTANAGVATAVVSPRTSTTTGADLVTAAVTLAGITARDSAAAQFTGTASTGTPVLQLALSSTSISAASPATVTATLTDSRGQPVSGQVVTFNVVRGLARTNIGTALTDAAGRGVVVLSPATASAAGADEITASASYAGASLQASQGFQVQATAITLDAFSAEANPLSAYGQTTLTLTLTGASVSSPVNISVSSACVSQGKATLSPSTFTATSGTVTMQYRDSGCGAVQASDQLLAVVTATGVSRALTLNIDAPAESSIAFVQAAPEQIFLKGSGFTESSVVTFEVRDAAGNPLPGRVVELRLQTGAGGVTMEGRGVESVAPPSANPFTLTSNALGRVAVRVNSGTLPTPVRINARLQGSNPVIATVSSNLSVAIGLPSQLNFSLSQGTKNIEGYNIDGTPNTYQIIAADRSGNPVPAGTSINFVTEGGQVEAIKQTQLVNGIARTTANFVSSDPRPVDGRVTITSYALGEESFLDLNGNNVYDGPGSANPEPFQDLGNIFKDRNFDGSYDNEVDEYVPLEVNNASACTSPANNLLLVDGSIPSMPATCDGAWSGAGQVYVRRATETVLSTSGARPLWASIRGLDASCRKITLQVGPNPTQTAPFTTVAGDTWYGGTSDTLSFIVGDANPGRAKPPSQWAGPTFDPNLDYELFPRLNPMAAGTVISASTPTSGLTVTLGGGSPVASTTEASLASVAYSFTDATVNSGLIFVTFRSPSGTGTTVSVPVVRGVPRPTECPAD